MWFVDCDEIEQFVVQKVIFFFFFLNLNKKDPNNKLSYMTYK